jgi:flagellar motility protein MotE (MotC chaperone)
MDQLVKVYETMSPEEAAARMNIMDEKLAIELLSGMKGKTVGKILGNMTAEKAADLSSKLAKR